MIVMSRLLLTLLLLSLLGFGCDSSQQSGVERYVPKPDVAQRAIETVFKSWQRGESTGEIAGTADPLLFVVDSHRQSGQKLDQFEVLGEVPGHTKRCYLVKLSFSNPSTTETARYAVMGIDPLWVYRHEDLEMLAHWEHPMAPASAKPAKDALPDAASNKEVRRD